MTFTGQTIAAPSGNFNFARHGYDILHGGWVLIDPTAPAAHREYMNVSFDIVGLTAELGSKYHGYARNVPGVFEVDSDGAVTRGSAIALLVYNTFKLVNYVQSASRYANAVSVDVVGLGGAVYHRDHSNSQRSYEFWDHNSRVQAWLGSLGFFRDGPCPGDRWWEIGALMPQQSSTYPYMGFRFDQWDEAERAPVLHLNLYLRDQDVRGSFRLKKR